VLAALFELQQAEAKGLSLPAYYASEGRDRTVLLLGSYAAPGIERLRQLEAAVRAAGYEPVLISDVPDVQPHTLSQKVVAIGALSRFVIVDDTDPSGHLTEIGLCKTNDWITILLRPDGRPSSAMSLGLSLTNPSIREASYSGEGIADALPDHLAWAEQRRKELGRHLNKEYPWRTQSL
jgi:hypothetical protein